MEMKLKSRRSAAGMNPAEARFECGCSAITSEVVGADSAVGVVDVASAVRCREHSGTDRRTLGDAMRAAIASAR